MVEDVYTAKLRYARISATKVRRIANLIRGKNVNRALDILSIIPNRASFFLYYLLKSAISNANNVNPRLNVDNLYISRLLVGDGPMMKRWRAMARGRAGLIRKRFCHIFVELSIPVEEEKSEEEKSEITSMPEPQKQSKQENSKPTPTQESKEQNPKSEA